VIPRFQVYVFDVDGTLLDSAEDICGAVRQTLAGTGCGPLPFEFLKSYIGRHLLDLFGDIFPNYTPEQIDALIQQYRAHYPARGHKLTRLYPGVVEGLEALSGRKSIATTKGTPTTRLILEQFGLLRFFDHVQGTDGFPCKPAPDVILRSIGALGADPGECLMVGDSAADMAAGRAAGVKICAVRYGYGKPADLARFEPDFWVDDLRELACTDLPASAFSGPGVGLNG
jgi:2-phosphoglycolate phosphatase